MAFEFVLTTDEIREKMIDFLKGNKKYLYYSINWKYGVYDKESGIFITLIDYTLSLGHGSSVYEHIVITDKGEIFEVSSEDDCYDFEIPAEYAVLSHKVKEGVKFYVDYESIGDFFGTIKEKSEELDRISEAMKKRLYNSES